MIAITYKSHKFLKKKKKQVITYNIFIKTYIYIGLIWIRVAIKSKQRDLLEQKFFIQKLNSQIFFEKRYFISFIRSNLRNIYIYTPLIQFLKNNHEFEKTMSEELICEVEIKFTMSTTGYLSLPFL